MFYKFIRRLFWWWIFKPVKILLIFMMHTNLGALLKNYGTDYRVNQNDTKWMQNVVQKSHFVVKHQTVGQENLLFRGHPIQNI